MTFSKDKWNTFSWNWTTRKIPTTECSFPAWTRPISFKITLSGGRNWSWRGQVRACRLWGTSSTQLMPTTTCRLSTASTRSTYPQKIPRFFDNQLLIFAWIKIISNKNKREALPIGSVSLYWVRTPRSSLLFSSIFLATLNRFLSARATSVSITISS